MLFVCICLYLWSALNERNKCKVRIQILECSQYMSPPSTYRSDQLVCVQVVHKIIIILHFSEHTLHHHHHHHHKQHHQHRVTIIQMRSRGGECVSRVRALDNNSFHFQCRVLFQTDDKCMANTRMPPHGKARVPDVFADRLSHAHLMPVE